ncbi:hypothetical protein EBR56_01540 [bacterium]|nr:hypothetical protein [bacterium]
MKKSRTQEPAGAAASSGPAAQSSKSFAEAVGRALRRSARTARRLARMHGTAVYVWRDGKVVAEKP